jgi:septum formation protein
MKLILASASPRRQQMLRDLGLAFEVRAPGIDESRLRGEHALAYVQRLAREKAENIADAHSPENSREWAVLAADTVVVHGTLVLGKPRNEIDALKMLRKLSGSTHEVITAFCWKSAKSCHVGHSRTKVTFIDMPDAFWKWYISTGEPMDKAGAYAAQGIGMSFIKKVSGSYSNVVGLPLSQVLEVFEKQFGGTLRELCAAAK